MTDSLLFTALSALLAALGFLSGVLGSAWVGGRHVGRWSATLDAVIARIEASERRAMQEHASVEQRLLSDRAEADRRSAELYDMLRLEIERVGAEIMRAHARIDVHVVDHAAHGRRANGAS